MRMVQPLKVLETQSSSRRIGCGSESTCAQGQCKTVARQLYRSVIDLFVGSGTSLYGCENLLWLRNVSDTPWTVLHIFMVS